MSKPALALAFVASLPILLHVINPSAELGTAGMILGFWGMFVSPLVIIGTGAYLIFG
ncbi:MAG: hypothetical protein KC502_17490 [Myxococcales bacterium]|nr:hypothetical protein [Myxococcales bacterium]